MSHECQHGTDCVGAETVEDALKAIEASAIPPRKRGSCGDCQHFNILDGGQCRAKPPTLVPVAAQGGLQLLGAWPPVKESGWCGEFRSGNES